MTPWMRYLRLNAAVLAVLLNRQQPIAFYVLLHATDQRDSGLLRDVIEDLRQLGHVAVYKGRTRRGRPPEMIALAVR